jgi:HlyD family secretion protein
VAVSDAQVAVNDAKEDLEDAQEDLDEANAKSPLIIAPFDGFITRVNAEGGDEVMKGTVVVQIADPDQFEAEILVSEMDIMQVEIGNTAWVEVDALSGLSLPAEVTHISPTATISSGVVNYTVKVELLSSENITQRQETARQQVIEEFSSGEMPEQMKQAIEEGRITQEQAEEFMERMQSGEMPSPPEGGFGQGQESPGTGSGQLPTVIPEDYQLREGLTVTVNLIVNSATNVLLVPNAAITTRGQQSIVQLVSANSTEEGIITEERVIETGVTDYQFTEVTSGLSEGEEILVPEGTATTVTTTEQDRPGGGLMIPGMGGGPR